MLPGVKGLAAVFLLEQRPIRHLMGALSGLPRFHRPKLTLCPVSNSTIPSLPTSWSKTSLAWMLREITKGQLLAYHG